MNKQLQTFQKIKRVKRLPLRDEITKEIYDYLMSIESLTFNDSRNKCAITFLKISGLRVNEIKTLTWKQIRLALKEGELNIYQSKTNSYRKILFTKAAKDLIHNIEKDLQNVFQSRDHWQLGNTKNGKLLRADDWIKNINKFLKIASHKFHKNLSSHSFRIGYITGLLKHLPIEKVRVVVGHREISTTARYDRYVPDNEGLSLIIDKILND